MLLVLLIALILIVVLSIVGFFYFQLKSNKRKQAELSSSGAKSSSKGICSRCQQHRIIVKNDPQLCASCWSSINTKQI